MDTQKIQKVMVSEISPCMRRLTTLVRPAGMPLPSPEAENSSAARLPAPFFVGEAEAMMSPVSVLPAQKVAQLTGQVEVEVLG